MPETKAKDKTERDEGFIVPPPVERGELVVSERRQERQFATRQTIWSSLPETQKALLRSKADKLDDNELASALELAFAYGLDPYTSEIWFTKSNGRNGNPGKLLIMVGRDGLRKIVQRNRMDMRGDVIHENDQFAVTHEPDRTSKVRHVYAHPSKRGPMVASWAEVWDPKTGRQKGFFLAYLDQYEPTDASSYSPWSKQKSVMLLAAAERQAARQATPLGGIIVEGEDETINSTDAEYEEIGADEARKNSTLPPEVLAIVDRARELDFGGFDYFTVELIVSGASQDAIDTWVESATADLDDFENDKKVAALDAEWHTKHTDFMTEAASITAALDTATGEDDKEAIEAARKSGKELRERFDAAKAEYLEERAKLVGDGQA
jgi:hypothetical protein